MNLLKTTVLLLGAVAVTHAMAQHPLTVFAEARIQERLQVASVLESALFEASEEEAPPTENPDEYVIEKLAGVPGVEGEEPDAELASDALDTTTERIIIAIRRTWETGSASVYLNDQEVMRFRAEVGELSPYERARIVAERLYQYLIKEGDLEAIKPDTANGETVIKAGDELLVTIDGKTAEAAKNPKRHLATLWSNLIRKSLGVKELPAAPEVAGFVPTGRVEKGQASWYGPGFHGRTTASGTRYNMYEMTAAHQKLPFGTFVKVFNHHTQRTCVVKITDRGPFAHGRIIDLSKAAADAIGMSGVAPVTIEIVQPAAQELADNS